MKRMLRRGAVYVLLVFLVLGTLVTAFAEERRVFDDAGLFTSSEVELLEARVAASRKQAGVDIVIVTTDDARGKTAMAYADDYYDENGFGVGKDYSGVLFLIDMDNRELYISTSGLMIRILTDARIESILDDVYVGASNNDFMYSASVFLEDVVGYVEDGIEKGQYNYDTETGQISRYRSVSLGQLLLFALISVGVGVGVCFIVKAKYQMKAQQYAYPLSEKATLNVTRREDEMTGSYITSRRIETSSSSGGGGGGGSGRSSTHSSSSGRSHGGGGRGF